MFKVGNETFLRVSHDSLPGVSVQACIQPYFFYVLTGTLNLEVNTVLPKFLLETFIVQHKK